MPQSPVSAPRYTPDVAHGSLRPTASTFCANVRPGSAARPSRPPEHHAPRDATVGRRQRL